jgi:L-aminopeptidase/D-esterase-like protein
MREKKGLRGTLLSNCLMIIPLVLSACGSSFADNQLSKDTSMQLLSSDTQKKKDASSSENGSYKEIKVTEVGDIMIGQTENTEAGTGLTVFISKDGMPAGLDVRGGGPASRESELLDPLAAAQKINAIVLSGGSAFGLGAGDGVMEYLEKKKIGYDTGYAIVPLVVQSDLYDLSVGDSKVRPDAKMGYEAAKNAFENPNYKDGNYGAGCGATVGKIAGMDTCMKSGIGSYAIQIGELKIGAVVAVNALGDIYDWKTGKKIAGLLAEDKQGFRDTMEYMAGDISSKDKFTGNTTIGVIITNASFEKSQLCKIAGMAHDGYARSIRPVHTTADGDSIYAVSAGSVAADQDLVGSFAALVMSEAINRAVMSAETAYGFVSASDLAGRDG